MDCIFRTHVVFEMIDKETGEVVHREVSKSKEFDSLVEMLGYEGLEHVESQLAVKTEAVTYDEDGFPKEPEVRTQELSESAQKVVYEKEEGALEKDEIFLDMELPVEDDEPSNATADSVLSTIDDDTLTASLTGDTDKVNEFGELSDLSFDLNDEDGKEDKRYTMEETFGIEEASDKKETEPQAAPDVDGLNLDFLSDDAVAIVDDSVDDLPFADEDEEDDFKSRISKLDNLF